MPGRPFYEMYAMIEESRLRALDEIARIDAELLALSNTWYQELVVIKRQLETIHGELGAYRNFGLSEYTFVIMGWIPKKYLERTRKMLKDTFSDRVIVHDLAGDGKRPGERPGLLRQSGVGQTVRVHHAACRPATVPGS